MGGEIMIYWVQGCKRGKLGRKIRCIHLVNMFEPDDVLEAAFSHIAQFCPDREPVLDQIMCDLRKQDLSAMSDGHDPLRQRQRRISFIRCTLSLQVIL